MFEPSEDPQDATQDNPRTRERPSDQGRKAMMVVIALLLLVAAGTAWNVVSRTNAKELDPEPQTRVNVTPTSDASLQDTFASRLERRKQALRDAQLPTPVRQLIPDQASPLAQEAGKTAHPGRGMGVAAGAESPARACETDEGDRGLARSTRRTSTRRARSKGCGGSRDRTSIFGNPRCENRRLLQTARSD